MNKYEQETIITWNNAEKEAEVYTHDQKLIHLLDELSEKSHIIQRETNFGKARRYILPKRAIKVRLPRELSEEQREKVRLRLISARQMAKQAKELEK